LKIGRHKDIRFFLVPKVTTNQRTEHEVLTLKIRTEWIVVVTLTTRMCEKVNVFVANISSSENDLLSGTNIMFSQLSILGKKNTKRKATTNWQKKTERARKRRQQAIERTKLEAAEKQKCLNASGLRIAEIKFNNSGEPCSSAFEALSGSDHTYPDTFEFVDFSFRI